MNVFESARVLGSDGVAVGRHAHRLAQRHLGSFRDVLIFNAAHPAGLGQANRPINLIGVFHPQAGKYCPDAVT